MTDQSMDEGLRAVVERVFILAHSPHTTVEEAHDLRTLLSALRQRDEALEPSEDTKAAYMGEFKFPVTRWDEDEDGEPVESTYDVIVPWTTIKEIMAAIKARAILTGSETNAR